MKGRNTFDNLVLNLIKITPFNYLFRMKKIVQIVAFILCSTTMFAQLNMDLVGELGYNNTNLSDIWGWADPDDGTEYAIVGLGNGTSIVSLADPANPTEVQYIPGQQSTWRDIKTWGDYAYVTCDEGGSTEGLLVIDLTNAPDNITWFNWNPTIAGEVMNKCHNIYIDEFGYAYLAGCNNNDGGMLIIDVFTTPGTPILEAIAPSVYSHDVFTRDNIMYSSEIYEGHLGIYDVSDKTNITLQATQPTPANFTHNAWLSDDSNTVFTTDEVANAPIGAYDISDLDNIVEVDQFLPIETIGEGVIPHNVHVWEDWLLISYYTDGGIVVDASNPSNLIEVGNFDTFLGGNGGFSGAWGLYPFLPSGLVLVSDIGNGLFVLQPNLVRACWLEGFVTDANTGVPIFGADVSIDSPQANMGSSDLTGEYKTGQAISGIFDVTFSAAGYVSQTVPATLENGVITILNVQLGTFPLTGNIVKAANGQPVTGGYVLLSNANETYEATSDLNGKFPIPMTLEGDFDVLAAGWGCAHLVGTATIVSGEEVFIELETGYQDDFFADLGWVLNNQGATTGDWERAEPIGTNFQGQQSNTDTDVSNDLGDECYVTGNGGGGAGNDDIDGGITQLISPVIDLSGYNLPVLTFSYWFFNAGGQGTPNDQLEVRISNGTDEVVLLNTNDSNSEWMESEEYNLADFIILSNNMTLIVESGDQDPGHLAEAAFDKFLIAETSLYPPFSISTTSGCVPETVQFMDNSDSTATYSWVFEGGNPATSTEANPSVTYENTGNFTVSLMVMTDEGSIYELTNTDIIMIGDEPTADFSFTTIGNVINFENTSVAGTDYSWNFGDMGTSTMENPSYTYNETGTYNVTLTTTNACGSSMVSFSIEVSSVPPLAGFDISDLMGCAPFEVNFSDQSTGTPTTWEWAIPGSDNETSTEQNPTVTYDTPGTYSVSLTVINDSGTSNVIESQVIVVEAAPTVNFSAIVGDAGEVVFTNLSENSTQFVWDFGDDNESEEENPTYTYAEAGEYTVLLTAINDCGQVGFAGTVTVIITDVEDIYKNVNFTAFPNPFAESIAIGFDTEIALNDAKINVFNALGQLMETYQVAGNGGVVAVGNDLRAGLYFVELQVAGKVIQQEKIVKVK
ncbi:MAG: choice-of-anchor B domain-containing protein [Paraglaciecola sp.]